MERAVLIVVLALTAVQCYGAVQVQMPEHAELQTEDTSDLQAQIKELQRNVSDIWTYIYELRSAVSQHLTHLRQHQVEIESAVHRMGHYHEDSHSHGDSHHHGGDEQHTHIGEQHTHGDDHGHSHSGEHHSHSGEHHSHSGEHHSHSGEHHSHSAEHHSHSGEHHSHSHSHSDGHEDSHSHSHVDHKDSHETEDLSQTTQQVQGPPPAVEPVVSVTTRREHYHHHHHQDSQTGNSMNLMGEHGFNHHHHHHQDSATSRNRTVELPRYSDYDQYDFALCNVQPNRAIPEEKQQNIGGTVTLWQKKSGGPLNFHVRLQGFNVGGDHDHHGAHQAIQQEQDNETPVVVGHRHGFHIHASGDLSNGCQSTGGHFNPKNVNHGGPTSAERHVGDLGNIECDTNGVTNILFSDDLVSLRGQYPVVGKAIVIHADPDDFGQGGDDESLKTGNAGTRLACCVIQKVDKLPIRYYKAMKSATQYKNS